jgi:hypothetical protein
VRPRVIVFQYSQGSLFCPNRACSPNPAPGQLYACYSACTTRLVRYSACHSRARTHSCGRKRSAQSHDFFDSSILHDAS